MSLHSNNLKRQRVSQNNSSSSSSNNNNKRQKTDEERRQLEVEDEVMRESMQERLKNDAILRIIYPTEDGTRSGSYVKQLNDYCSSILRMYELHYEQQNELEIEDWLKKGIQGIIQQSAYVPKLALIFFALATEQWFANNFVPPTQIVYDAAGNALQVPNGEVKVDPNKFVKYMYFHLIPLTQKYLNGEEGVSLQDYVHNAMLAWYMTSSSIPRL